MHHYVSTSHFNCTHGMDGTPEYKAWIAAKARCFNPNDKDSEHYSERGITMCDGWRSGFESFFASLGLRPSAKHSLGRIDNELHYSCGECAECKSNGWSLNCRWETPIQQHRNKRNNRLLTVNGETRCMSEWADLTGLSKNVIYARLKRGWSQADAVLTPVCGSHV